MKLIIEKPYQLFWIFVPFVLGLSFLKANNTIDLQMYDTYYVIGLNQLGILFSIFSGIIGLLYWLVRTKLLVTWMISFHVIITISIMTLLVLNGMFFNKVFTLTNTFVILALLTIFSQFIFIMNLIICLFRRTGS